MMGAVHFIRPWAFVLCIPLIVGLIIWWRQAPSVQGWSKVCDSHLLDYLLQHHGAKKPVFLLWTLGLSLMLMVVSLSGPAWHRLPVPVYKAVHPTVVLLDMSQKMMQQDLSPNSLARAKFQLRDLLNQKDVGQIGLCAYTSEPFVVSPLTDDGKTIASMLDALTVDIMPVGGHNLSSALLAAKKMIEEAGYHYGQILVMTNSTPSGDAIDTASTLAKEGFDSSIMPFRADKELNPLFERFASSGHGFVLDHRLTAEQLAVFANKTISFAYEHLQGSEVPLWQDEGRWFLLPALMLLAPLFRRGFLAQAAL
jgi:Ca-activated chloride channel family protein